MKSFLLDQRVIAGLGNIYVCEALFRAGLPPDAEAGLLAKASAAGRRQNGLRKHQRRAGRALLAGGSSIRDYRHADGEGGTFQEKFDVYARAGQPCHNDCGAPIERKAQQGRSTFFARAAKPNCERISHGIRDRAFRKRGRVGLITLNRPQALNALNAQLISELNQVLDLCEADIESAPWF